MIAPLCLLAALAGMLLLLGWVGYPLALGWIASHRRAIRTAAPIPVGASVVIATRESPELILRRVANVRETAPAGLDLEIVIGVDPASGFPLDEYQAQCGRAARVVPGDAPGGKACNLNAAVRAAAHPVLIFTDSAQSFLPDSIDRLLRPFGDPTVGSVTGTLRFGAAAANAPVLDRFWSYELKLRELESRIDSVVAVTGAIYALRRALWVPLPDGLICDDLFIPMHVVRQGSRVVAAGDSFAIDERRFTRSQEFRRKVRTLTGMIQFSLLCPWALAPWRNRIWPQFVCHKLLRLSTPYLLVFAVLAGGLCARLPWQWWLGIPLAGLALLLLTALAPSTSRPRRLGRQAVWAGYLLLAPLAATLNALRGNWDVWTPQRHPPR